MTIISGDCGGIAFRHNAEAKSGYFFSVCQDGSYALGLYRDSGKNPQTLANSSSTAIHTGYNQSNVIAVAANGSSIGLYVNDQQIGNVNDTAYSSGVIALCANAPYGSTEVAYSNARLWTL